MLTDPAAVVPGDVPLVNPNDPEAVAAATRSLPNSEQLPAAAENQLIAFSRFEASDPFVQLVEESDEASNTDAPPGKPHRRVGNRHDPASDDDDTADVDADLGHDVDQPASRDPGGRRHLPDQRPGLQDRGDPHPDSLSKIGIADGSVLGRAVHHHREEG